MHRKVTLANGLRIVTTSMPHTRSVAMGIYTGVGSRYETEAEGGTSHFIEHMLFKGTARRPTAQQIAEEIEGLGGELNASTSDEVTTYWAKVADQHFPIALDVLLDMFRHSTLAPEEVEKERQVITQEICREMDTPEARVHTLIKQMVWPDHPIGRDTAGTKESVSAISRQNMLDYIARNYAPCSTVISLAGKLDQSRVVDQLNENLGDWQAVPKPAFAPVVDAPTGPRVRVEYKETEQAHVCVGLRGLSSDSPDRFKLGILNTILGEGMSSRLFLEIREKRGLAYSVGSYTSRLRDTGSMVLYAGVPPRKAPDTVSAMMEQLALLRDTAVPGSELTKAKEFTKGQLLLHMESTQANANWVAGQEVTDRKVLSVDEVIARVDAVTAEDVQQIARCFFAMPALSLAAIGPFKGASGFRSRLKL